MIQKNEVHIIDITGMTHEGQGVGRINNFTIFTEGALPGEKVEVKLTKINKTYGFARLLNILEVSKERQEPFCSVFKRCGGCSMQHMSYKEQLKFKTDLVRDNLKRIGGISDIKVHDCIGMEDPFSYRNKAQFPVSVDKEGKSVIGFYANRSHEVIDSDKCWIQEQVGDKVRRIVRDFVQAKGIPVYDEEKGTGILRHVMTRTGFKTGEVMIALVVNENRFPHAEELVKLLVKEIQGVKSIYLNVNKKNTNVILGEDNVLLYGVPVIREFIGEFVFEISVLSFFQVNPVQTDVLYRKAIEFAGLTGKEVVFDLYCGIGTISLFLSKMAAKVYGVEVVEDAVRDARRNAEINGVGNVEFLVGEAETLIPGIGVKADVVVLDPPRKGCDERLLDTLVEMAPERIVYVSCNPSTLARDLKYLVERGFEAKEAQPVDMFPWTGHVECVVRIQRIN